ncbi:hypothetical protein J8J27_35090, partial [Mycobacterium tuberculosis]|nr:hypothetical protein [Mycobacterium tuberculosis]
MTVSLGRLNAARTLFAVGAFAGVVYTQRSVLPALGAALLLGPVAPILVLRFLRKRRWAAFGAHFPDAIDIIVRS